MKTFRTIIALATLATCLPAAAQNIDFESQNGFRAIGVYDTWEESPFRNGTISDPSAYAKIVENPDAVVNEETGIAPNPSQKVLAVQRSRFGSNTFGARIDLTDTLRLGTATRYVHVMIHKPAGETASVMVIGLGKRRSWVAQSPETEQFWVNSTSTIQEDSWTDLVFPITTNEYVDIHSLVVVPDLASPHQRSGDFVAYIDNIAIDDSPLPRFRSQNYPVNFEMAQGPTRSDRQLSAATITATGETSQSVTVDKSRVYNNQVETKFIKARPNSTITVKYNYSGTWMSGYVYVDWDNDGQFVPQLAENKPTEASELVSYTHLNGYNSLGQEATGNNVSGGVITCPAFKVPQGTPYGIYRMRFKVDWNSADPGGNANAGNLLVDNGGSIVDLLLNIHPDSVDISANQLNGDVLSAATLEALSNNRIRFGRTCKVKAAPAPGFTYTGIVITHGYNLDGEQYIRGNKQFDVDTIPATSFNANNEYTIPSAMVNGEVRIEGLFTPDLTAIKPIATEATTAASSVIYTADGKKSIAPPEKGVYIVGRKKYMK